MKREFDVALYGHMSYDTIFEDGKLSTSVGCMGNVWKELVRKRSNIRIHLSPTNVGQSLILVDKWQSRRTSVSSLNDEIYPALIQPAKISHVLYLNELDNYDTLDMLEEIKANSDIVMADVCNGAKFTFNDPRWEFIDILLISEEDYHLAKADTSNFKYLNYLLVHNSTGSALFDTSSDNDPIRFTAERVDQVNVL